MRRDSFGFQGLVVAGVIAFLLGFAWVCGCSGGQSDNTSIIDTLYEPGEMRTIEAWAGGSEWKEEEEPTDWKDCLALAELGRRSDDLKEYFHSSDWDELYEPLKADRLDWYPTGAAATDEEIRALYLRALIESDNEPVVMIRYIDYLLSREPGSSGVGALVRSNGFSALLETFSAQAGESDALAVMLAGVKAINGQWPEADAIIRNVAGTGRTLDFGNLLVVRAVYDYLRAAGVAKFPSAVTALTCDTAFALRLGTSFASENNRVREHERWLDATDIENRLAFADLLGTTFARIPEGTVWEMRVRLDVLRRIEVLKEHLLALAGQDLDDPHHAVMLIIKGVSFGRLSYPYNRGVVTFFKRTLSEQEREKLSSLDLTSKLRDNFADMLYDGGLPERLLSVGQAVTLDDAEVVDAIATIMAIDGDPDTEGRDNVTIER